MEKEGWAITHDPYFIRLGKRKGFIDLGAEIIGAERGTERIAVEEQLVVGTTVARLHAITLPVPPQVGAIAANCQLTAN